MGEKERTLRALGARRPFKAARRALPLAPDSRWRLRSQAQTPRRFSRRQKTTQATAPAGVPAVVARAAAGGAWPASGEGRGKLVGGALAPSRRGGAGPDLGRERPIRAKDNTTSGPLTSGFAALGAGSGGWVERSLVRVSSAVGQCEPVTAAVAPRPRGSEVCGGGEEGKGPGRVSAHFLLELRRFQKAAAG